MEFIDKSIYLPDVRIMQPHKEVMQIFDTEDYKIYHDNNPQYTFGDTQEILLSFKEKFPEAFLQDVITNHMKRCYNYVKENNYDVANCFHYSGIDYDNSRVKGLRQEFGINIRINPFYLSD